MRAEIFHIRLPLTWRGRFAGGDRVNTTRAFLATFPSAGALLFNFLVPAYGGVQPLIQSAPGGSNQLNDADINSLTQVAIQAIAGEQ